MQVKKSHDHHYYLSLVVFLPFFLQVAQISDKCYDLNHHPTTTTNQNSIPFIASINNNRLQLPSDKQCIALIQNYMSCIATITPRRNINCNSSSIRSTTNGSNVKYNQYYKPATSNDCDDRLLNKKETIENIAQYLSIPLTNQISSLWELCFDCNYYSDDDNDDSIENLSFSQYLLPHGCHRGDNDANSPIECKNSMEEKKRQRHQKTCCKIVYAIVSMYSTIVDDDNDDGDSIYNDIDGFGDDDDDDDDDGTIEGREDIDYDSKVIAWNIVNST